MGDSHALSWFPAVNRLATERGWRLVNLTKSACASADVSQWNTNFKRVYTECDRGGRTPTGASRRSSRPWS